VNKEAIGNRKGKIIEVSQTWQFPDFTSISKDTIVENQTEYCDDHRKGFGKEILLDGIYFWYGHFNASSSEPIQINTSAPHVQMNFCIKNSTAFFSDLPTQPFALFNPHQHNLMLLPQRKMFVQWQADETELFSISITPDFFFDTLPETHFLANHFKDRIAQRLPAFFSLTNLPVTPRMVSTLLDIVHCDYSGYHKILFIKAKVIELLAMQFEQYAQLDVTGCPVSLKPEEFHKMHLARHILIENLHAPLSIKELAQQVGTNDYSLKKNFKAVFGTTVFGYLHDFRMEQSKELLSVDGSRISEVAKQIGYKHATHFTAAFKKYFGFLPNKIRVGLIYLLSQSEMFNSITNNLQETPI
jgi:AraC-like DNA-binding protein